MLWQLPHSAPKVHTQPPLSPLPRDAPSHSSTVSAPQLPCPGPLLTVHQLPWNLPAKTSHPSFPTGFFLLSWLFLPQFPWDEVCGAKKGQAAPHTQAGGIPFGWKALVSLSFCMSPPGGTQAQGIPQSSRWMYSFQVQLNYNIILVSSAQHNDLIFIYIEHHNRSGHHLSPYTVTFFSGNEILQGALTQPLSNTQY